MKTFKELAEDKQGTIYEDWFDEGVRCLIMRGLASLCAYLGVPIDHPLAGHNYGEIPLSVHGGLTYGNIGDGALRPKDFYWYGWDYGHCDDKSFYYLKDGFSSCIHSKGWTVEEVKSEVEDALWNFKKILRLLEK